MTTTGAGRPRLATRKRPGATAREEILDAAAELFTTRGFTTTSTRMVADAVGVRQASLYHHFATKDDILAALLVGTVDAPLAYAAELRKVGADAPASLYSLVLFDARLLSSSRWNLGALYLIPELRTERFEYFRTRRGELMDLYAEAARGALAAIGTLRFDDDAAVEDTVRLPFRIVETVINARSDADVDADAASVRSVPSTVPESIADAALRVLGWREGTIDVRRQAIALLEEISPRVPPPRRP